MLKICSAALAVIMVVSIVLPVHASATPGSVQSVQAAQSGQAVQLTQPAHGSVNPKPSKRPEVGITTGGTLLNMSDEALDKRLSDMKSLGARWVRMDFSWKVLQPNNAQEFDFQFHDRVVAAAERKGLKIMGVLAYTPKWARSSDCKRLSGPRERLQSKCAPRNDDDFVAFAKQVATRYRQNEVWAWEIWNEPNLLGHWREVNAQGKLAVNPAHYAQLANRTALAIRGVDRAVQIVTGGLAPMFEPLPSRGMRQSDFLREMLPHLDRRGVTAIGVHPYSWPAPPDKAADWNAFYTVDQGAPRHNLRAILNEGGRNDLKLWATEYGASTVGRIRYNGRVSKKARPDHVNERTQAQIVEVGVEGWSKKSNVGPLFVHADSDQYLPKHRNEGGFGLRRGDGTPKPAYQALKRAVAHAQERR